MSHPGATRNWVCFASRWPNTSTLVPSEQESSGRSQLALFGAFLGLPAPSRFTGHWSLATLFSPLATRPYSEPLALSKIPHPAQRLSVGATRGPLRTPNCQREGAASRHLCIVQSRRAVPKILGTQVFPDAASVSAIDSSCWNRAPALPLITAFCPGLPWPALRLDPMLPGPLGPPTSSLHQG